MTTYTVTAFRWDGTVAFLGERLRDRESRREMDRWFIRGDVERVAREPEQNVQRGGGSR